MHRARRLGTAGLLLAATACGGSKQPSDGLSDSSRPSDSGVPTDSGTTDDTGADPVDTGGEDSGSTADSGDDPDTGDTGDTGALPHGPGAVVLGGGDDQGEIGDGGAWSARLFAQLFEGGDVTGDDQIRVVILTDAPEPDDGVGYLDSLAAYLSWLGGDEVEIQVVDTVAVADEVDLAGFDIAFLVPQSAGTAYDAWNDTRLETELHTLWQDRGGALGANGDGSMLLAGVALAGGRDYIATHLMLDGHTDELDDESDGGSALHDDFLPVVPGAIIDTRFTEQGRLIRLVGALARWVDEVPGTPAWGMGIDRTTGVVIRAGTAEVIGDGGVTLIRPTADSVMEREVDLPPIWTHLALDRLTEGWAIDLSTGAPIETTVPAAAEAVAWDGVASAPIEVDWSVDGHITAHEERFSIAVDRDASGYATHLGASPPAMPDALGILDLNFYGTAAVNHEAVYRALYDHPGLSAVLITYQGRLEHRATEPGVIRLTYNAHVVSRDDPDTLLERREPSHAVIDASGVRWRSLAATPSAHDPSGTTLHAAGLVGLRLHLLANSDGTGWVYDLVSRDAVME
jgi:cyanophycinase-like exopeptidase